MMNLKSLALVTIFLVTVSFSQKAMSSFDAKYSKLNIVSKIKLKTKKRSFAKLIKPGKYKASFGPRGISILLRGKRDYFPLKLNTKRYKFIYKKKFSKPTPFSKTKVIVKSCSYTNGDRRINCSETTERICEIQSNGEQYCLDVPRTVCSDDLIYFSGKYAEKFKTRKAKYKSSLNFFNKRNNKILASITGRGSVTSRKIIKKTVCAGKLKLPRWARK